MSLQCFETERLSPGVLRMLADFVDEVGRRRGGYDDIEASVKVLVRQGHAPDEVMRVIRLSHALPPTESERDYWSRDAMRGARRFH